MPLSEDDVREILRLIDESDARELRVETGGLSLYVRRDAGSAPDSEAPEPPSAPAAAATVASDVAPVAIRAPMLGTFYRAQAPGGPRSWRSGSVSSRTRSSA